LAGVEIGLPLVTVVITTRNEEKNIGLCLKSVQSQSWPKVEVIVVDNGSEDRTKEIAYLYTNLVYDKGPERSAQRNYGLIEKSTGSYLMYVDADMVLAPRTVELCMAQIEREQLSGLYIPELILGKCYWSQVRRFERLFYNATCIDGARFFRKDIFSKVGGFDEELFQVGSGEDWDLDQSLLTIGEIGYTGDAPSSIAYRSSLCEEDLEDRELMLHAGAVIFHNEQDFSLSRYLKKKSYYTAGFDGYIKKWGKENEFVKRQFSIRYRYLVVFLENRKWKMLFKKPHLVPGVLLLRFLVGVLFSLRALRRFF
jgi:glycosyltransferase involved in cell wall biosynthesis